MIDIAQYMPKGYNYATSRQGNGDSPISFCHDGPAIVVLELSKAFLTRFDGTME